MLLLLLWLLLLLTLTRGRKIEWPLHHERGVRGEAIKVDSWARNKRDVLGTRSDLDRGEVAEIVGVPARAEQ